MESHKALQSNLLISYRKMVNLVNTFNPAKHLHVSIVNVGGDDGGNNSHASGVGDLGSIECVSQQDLTPSYSRGMRPLAYIAIAAKSCVS